MVAPAPRCNVVREGRVSEPVWNTPGGKVMFAELLGPSRPQVLMQCWRQVVWTCEAFEPLLEQWHCSTTSQVRAPTAAIEATTSSSRNALIGIDPLDEARIHVSHLEEGGDLWMSSTPFAEDHLTHPPIALLDVVSTNDHEVTRADVKEGGLCFDGEVEAVERHCSL